MTKILLVGGLGSTGSSAVVDFLRDRPDFGTINEEFRLLTDPGGLLTLHNTFTNLWSHYQCSDAILRYTELVDSLSSRYSKKYANLRHYKTYNPAFNDAALSQLNNIADLEYKGLWYGNDSTLTRYLNSFKVVNDNNFVKRSMFVPRIVSKEAMDAFVRNTVTSVLKPHLECSSIFGLNENLSCMYPNELLRIFPDAKMLTVVRDPRDVLFDSRRVNWPSIPQDFDGYLKWQKSVYLGFLDVLDGLDPSYKERFKVIRFEDLVTNYDIVSKEILEFIEPEWSTLSGATVVKSARFFKPEDSMKNIGQWKGKLSAEQSLAFEKTLTDFIKYFDYDVGH